MYFPCKKERKKNELIFLDGEDFDLSWEEGAGVQDFSLPKIEKFVAYEILSLHK